MIYFLFLLAGQEAVVDNAHLVINCLTGLIAYPHMMVPDFFRQKKIKFTLLLTYPLSSLLHLFKLTLFLYKLFLFFFYSNINFFPLCFVLCPCLLLSNAYNHPLEEGERRGENLGVREEREGGGGVVLDGSNVF